jgi:hypothetical protein
LFRQWLKNINHQTEPALTHEEFNQRWGPFCADAAECDVALDPVNEGRCTNMRRSSGAASHYVMNSGFYLSLQFQKVLPVVFQLINRLVHIGQGGVTLLLLERGIHLRPPTFGQLFEGTHIQVAVMEECL